MTTHPNAQLAREVYRQFGAGNYDAVLDLCTDDIEATIVPFGMTYHGKDGFLAFMHGFKDAFPDMELSVDNQVVGSDDQIVNEISTTAVHNGPLQTPMGSIPATGKPVAFTVCEVWKVRDGKVAKLVNYQDAASLMRQIGAA